MLRPSDFVRCVVMCVRVGSCARGAPHLSTSIRPDATAHVFVPEVVVVIVVGLVAVADDVAVVNEVAAVDDVVDAVDVVDYAANDIRQFS